MGISVIQDTGDKQDRFISELMPGNVYSTFGITTVADIALIQRLREMRERGKIVIDCAPLPIGIDVVMKLQTDDKFSFARSGKDIDSMFYQLARYRYFVMTNNRGIWSVMIDVNDPRMHSNIKYHVGEVSHVHQLQNLFFAITGGRLSLID